jgi:ribosomal protein S18 acetylase RimI-like enzyme
MTPFPATPDISPLRHNDPVVAMAIVALQRKAYKVEAELVGYPDLPPLKESPADIMGSNDKFFGIASRGRLVAVISTEDTSDATVVSRLCVAPDCARRGHGLRLVRHVLDLAPGPVTVSTAQANAPALGLYRKLGFETCREWTTQDGLALVTLRHTGPAEAGE